MAILVANQLIVIKLNLNISKAGLTGQKKKVATGEKEFTLIGTGYITERLGGLDFRISAKCFWELKKRGVIR